MWTYHNQVALVVAVADRQASAAGNGGQAPHSGSRASAMASARQANGSATSLVGLEPDPERMAALTSVLQALLGGEGAAHVAYEVVVGDIHHERRLHRLLLAEEERSWEAQLMTSGASSLAGTLSAAINSPLNMSQVGPPWRARWSARATPRP